MHSSPVTWKKSSYLCFQKEILVSRQVCLCFWVVFSVRKCLCRDICCRNLTLAEGPGQGCSHQTCWDAKTEPVVNAVVPSCGSSHSPAWIWCINYQQLHFFLVSSNMFTKQVYVGADEDCCLTLSRCHGLDENTSPNIL